MNVGFHPVLLSATAYQDGKTWFLNHPLLYLSASGAGNDAVYVPRFFETDFASCPRLFQNAIPPWGTYGEAAVVHDWLYWTQLGARKQADDTLLEAMGVLGVVAWQRWSIYLAVRCFGWLAWRDNARLAKEGYSRIKGMRGTIRPTWRRQFWKTLKG